MSSRSWSERSRSRSDTRQIHWCDYRGLRYTMYSGGHRGQKQNYNIFRGAHCGLTLDEFIRVTIEDWNTTTDLQKTTVNWNTRRSLQYEMWQIYRSVHCGLKHKQFTTDAHKITTFAIADSFAIVSAVLQLRCCVYYKWHNYHSGVTKVVTQKYQSFWCR